jgi:hypothetical protein
LNEDILINLLYSLEKADTLFYAGAFLYQLEVIATG